MLSWKRASHRPSRPETSTEALGPGRGAPARNFREHSELVQEPETVDRVPVLDAPAAGETEDVELRDDDGVVRWRSPHELALVRVARGHAHGDAIAFGEDVLDREAKVGERFAEVFVEILQALHAG